MQPQTTNSPNNAQPQGAESLVVRAHERIRCELMSTVNVAPEHATMVVLSSNAVEASGALASTVVDLSRGGIGFRTKVYLPKQTRLIVRITDQRAGGADGEAALSALVKVMRVVMVDRTPTYEIGTAFVDPSSALKEQMMALIASVAKSSGPAGQTGGRASA